MPTQFFHFFPTDRLAQGAVILSYTLARGGKGNPMSSGQDRPGLVDTPIQIRVGGSSQREARLRACLEAADEHLSQGADGAAAGFLGEALCWNPASTRVWYALAQVHASQNDGEAQAAALRTAIECCPDDEQAVAWMKELAKLTDRPHQRCQGCGQIGTLIDHYGTANQGVLCPRCLGTLARQGTRRLTFILGRAMLVGPLLGGGTAAWGSFMGGGENRLPCLPLGRADLSGIPWAPAHPVAALSGGGYGTPVAPELDCPLAARCLLAAPGR